MARQMKTRTGVGDQAGALAGRRAGGPEGCPPGGDDSSAASNPDEREAGARRRAAPASRRGRERYDKILDVAERLFSTRDYHEVSINEIGREAGGSLATLYKWFGSKDDLVFAILLRRLEQVRRNVRNLNLQGRSVESDFQALIDFVFTNVPVGMVRATLFGSFVFQNRREEVVSAFASAILLPMKEYVERIAARRGCSFRLSAEEIALLIIRYARGFFIETALSDEDLQARVDAARAALLKLCLFTVDGGALGESK